MNNLFEAINTKLSEAELPYNNYEIIFPFSPSAPTHLPVMLMKNKVTEIVFETRISLETFKDAATLPNDEFEKLVDECVMEIGFIVERYEMR